MYDGSNYEEEKKSMDSTIAYILGGLALVILIVGIVRGIVTNGEASKAYGWLCIGGALSSLCGFVFAIEAWKEEGGFMTAKRGGIILNFILMFTFVMLFIIGIIG